MKGGDLDNRVAPYVAFRFQEVIKRRDGRFSSEAKNMILDIMDRTDMNVAIITTEDKRNAMSFMAKWGIPWNQVIEADSIYEIADICQEKEILVYYDTDDNILYNVRAKGKERTKAEKWISVQD